MANNPQADRHPPGYRTPKRQGRKILSIHVEPDLHAAVREAAAHDRITIQDKGEQFFRDYVHDYMHRTHNSRLETPLDSRDSLALEDTVPGETLVKNTPVEDPPDRPVSMLISVPIDFPRL